MALTGTGFEFGNARFGGVESYARAAASDGARAYNFGRAQGYALNVSTGASGSSGSAYSGSGTIRGATYHNGQVLVYVDSRDIYVWTEGTGFSASAEISNLRYATGSGFSGNPNINGFASHNGTLYIADSNEDHLFSVASDGVLTAIGSGFGNINIGGMTSHDGQLLGTDNTNDRLVVFDTTAGTVSVVANNDITGGRTVDFLLSHDGELYGGRFANGLMRFYNVEWDADVPGVSLDEETSETWDLSATSRDANSFEFDAASPVLSWLTISGNDLVATNAPDVTRDQTYNPIINAIRDGISDQLIHSITVNDLDPPPANNPPQFTQASYTFSNSQITVNSVIGTVAATDADMDTLTYTLTGTDNANFAIDATGQITVATELTYAQSYSFNVVADDTQESTSVPVTVTARTDPAGSTISTPPIIDSITEKTTSGLSFGFSPPAFDGNSAITRYRVRYRLDPDSDFSAWDTTTELTYTISEDFTANTYRIELQAENSVGFSESAILEPVGIRLFSIPSGTQLVSEIMSTDPLSKNDFKLRITAPKNITGLEVSGLTITGASFVENSLIGENSVYEITIRPPDTDNGDIVIEVAPDAVNEGDASASITIPYADTKADTEWETGLTSTETYTGLIEATPNRLYLTRDGFIDAWDTESETEISTERRTFPNDMDYAIPFGNNGYLVWQTTGTPKMCLLTADGSVVWVSDELTWDNGSTITDVSFRSWTLTRDGILVTTSGSVIQYTLDEINTAIRTGDARIEGDRTAISFNNGDVTVPDWNNNATIASDPDTGKIYVSNQEQIFAYTADRNIIEDEILTTDTRENDWLAIQHGTLYRWNADTLYSHDLRNDLAPTHTATVHPIHARPDETIDLYTLFYPFQQISEGVVCFDVGFDMPYFLSILTDNRYLKISSEVYSRQTVYLKLNGINQHGITETLRFYLIIEPIPEPTWIQSEICIYENQTVNLLELTKNANEVIWKRLTTPPTELNITDSQLSLTGTATQTEYELAVTAWKDSQFTDNTLTLTLIDEAERPEATERLDTFKITIEGIDVSNDLFQVPRISQSLDAYRVNEYVYDTCQIVLLNDAPEGNPSPLTYSPNITPNFWTANDLNYGGYLNAIKVFILHRDPTVPNAPIQEHLIFSGVIKELTDNIDDITTTLKCFENTELLQQVNLNENIFGIPKYIAPEPQSSEGNYEGVYNLPASITPALPENSTVEAYTDRTPLTLKDVVNYPEGVEVDNTAHWTGQTLATQGGLLDTPPLIFCALPYRKKSIDLSLRTLARNIKAVCGVNTELSTAITDEASMQALGNFTYDTENGRTERVPVDWIHDDTNNVLYILLSNPSNRVRDRLIRFDVATETYRLLYEFDADRSVYQITSGNFQDFYITHAKAIGSDLSVTDRLPTITNLEIDAGSAFSDNKISVFHQQFGDTTDATETERPQIGIHYWAGFSNKHYLYSYEGIQPESRSNFKVYTDSLYYRYATSEHFGVIKRDTDGSTTTIFEKDRDLFFNHLNFDFEIDTDGEVYLAYTNTGTLTLEKYVNGADNEVLFSANSHPNLDNGTSFLGVYELRKSLDNFYMIVPTQDTEGRYARSAGVAVLNWHVHQKVLRVLDTGEFCHWGAYGLTPHTEGDNDPCVFFTETPAVSYKLLPINPDLDTWNADEGYNNLSENKGTLKCILPQHRITEHGNTYFEQQAFRGTYCRGLSFNDGVHYVFGYGDRERIQAPDSPLISPDNLQWCSFQKEIKYRVDTLYSESTLYNEAKKLALQTNTAYFFDRGIINLRDNSPISARLTASIGTTIQYAGANREFPASGHLYINGEVIAYTTRTDTEFQGLTRKVEGSEASRTATAGDEFLYIDRLQLPVESPLEFPIRSNQYSNIIIDDNNLISIKSDTDLPEKPYRVSLQLTNHDVAWIQDIAEKQLARVSELKNDYQFRITSQFTVRLGDILYFNFSVIADTIRVVRYEEADGFTTLTGRPVQPTGVIPAPQEANPNETYRTLDGTGDPMFIDGIGDHAIFLGNNLNQEDGIFATEIEFEDEVPDLTFTAGVRIESVQLPPARGGSGSLFYVLIGLPDGITFNPITRRLDGITQNTQTATQVRYTAYDHADTAHHRTETFDITVVAEDTTSNYTLDGRGDIFFTDGTGDRVIFKG